MEDVPVVAVVPLKLGDILLRYEVIDDVLLKRALADQKTGDVRELGRILNEKYSVSFEGIHKAFISYLETIAANAMEKRLRDQIKSGLLFSDEVCLEYLAKVFSSFSCGIITCNVEWNEEWIQTPGGFVQVNRERETSAISGKMELRLEFVKLAKIRENISFTCKYRYLVKKKELLIHEDDPLVTTFNHLFKICGK